MMMKTEEVLAKFLTLPNAVRIGEGDKSFVYVPATKEKSVLLVAHADTVWNQGNADLKIVINDNTLESAQKGVGIGADDRAGICMLWKLRNTGHALLIPNMEERGCIGARFLMESEEWRKRINQHLFAIELDRMNSSDLAFYDIATDAFKDFCERKFPEYKRTRGSFTDITVLCDDQFHKEDTLCGVNVSVGYYGQHGEGERLVLPEWQRSLTYCYKLLTSEEELPRFAHKYVQYTTTSYYGGSGYTSGRSASYDIDYDYRGYNVSPKYQSKMTSQHVGATSSDLADSILVCPNEKCDAMFDETEYRQANNACPYCKESFE